MNRSSLSKLILLVTSGVLLTLTSVRSEETASLADVHKILLQAAGYQSDTAPTMAQQTDLLNKALEMIKLVPHVYHGQLKAASRAINDALSELANGDTAHKAKVDIYNADDQIKSIM